MAVEEQVRTVQKWQAAGKVAGVTASTACEEGQTEGVAEETRQSERTLLMSR